jgi:hypothetical protein
MKKSSKILLALATIWPFLYMILFMGVVLSSFFLQAAEPGFIWAIIIPLHILTMLWIMGLTVFYMVNVFRNDRVNKDMKVLWAVVLFMRSIIAMPIYWYLYIWRDVSAPSIGNEPPLVSSGSESQWIPQGREGERFASDRPPPLPPDWR